MNHKVIIQQTIQEYAIKKQKAKSKKQSFLRYFKHKSHFFKLELSHSFDTVRH